MYVTEIGVVMFGSYILNISQGSLPSYMLTVPKSGSVWCIGVIMFVFRRLGHC